MNPVPDDNQGADPDSDDIACRFAEYNAQKFDILLQRFPAITQKHIRTLPLFFHINQNLLPGYVNNHVPHTLYGYEPDADILHHAATFNSAFKYKHEEHSQSPAIEAVYLQDNLKSGKLILWIIHNRELDEEAVDLLKQKAAHLNAWRESRNIHLHCHIVLPHTMPAAYWGAKYNALFPDKSIFLDDFYSESILMAGKPSAWWHVPPDREAQYEQYIDQQKHSHEDFLNTHIDFGALTNPRPQDYLASLILNLLHVRNYPEETWLNILALCHKLSAWPHIDCLALHIKHALYAAPDKARYPDMYCTTISTILQRVYDRDKTILIDRVLYLLTRRHDNNQKSVNIYRLLLAHRNSTDFRIASSQDYEYSTAVDILHDLIRHAVSWFVHTLRKLDTALLPPFGDTDILISNLLHRIEKRTGHVGIANYLPIKYASTIDICFKHNIENRHNGWSLLIANTDLIIRHGKDPFELAAWGVFNRIITHNSRLSVNCPYFSIRQTQIADITAVLLQHLPGIEPAGFSMQTFMTMAAPVEDILIINEIRIPPGDSEDIHIYRFLRTSHDEIICEQYRNMSGFLQLACKALGGDMQSGNKPHGLFMHSIGGVKSKSFLAEARNVYNKMTHFLYGTNRHCSHFIDTVDGTQYAIAQTSSTLSLYHNITLDHPEHFVQDDDYVMMHFSTDVNNHSLLNYVYRNSTRDRLQLFYQIHATTAQIYIIDEQGILTQFSQPFHDPQSFINQWLMFLFHSRNRIQTSADQSYTLPNIDIYELTYNKFGQLIKNRLNSAMIPKDDHYFDLKVSIQGDKGNQVILFSCEDREFSSTEHGTGIYSALRKYLAANFKTGLANPIYVSDIDIPPSQLHTTDDCVPHLRDYIRYKINIEKRLNAMIKKA